MAASQMHITPRTPMGANVLPDGTTFRVWAPGAHEVHAVGDFNDWTRDEASKLVRHDDGRWTGFFPVRATACATSSSSSGTAERDTSAIRTRVS